MHIILSCKSLPLYQELVVIFYHYYIIFYWLQVSKFSNSDSYMLTWTVYTVLIFVLAPKAYWMQGKLWTRTQKIWRSTHNVEKWKTAGRGRIPAVLQHSKVNRGWRMQFIGNWNKYTKNSLAVKKKCGSMLNVPCEKVVKSKMVAKKWLWW